jgi:hypothetical protein
MVLRKRNGVDHDHTNELRPLQAAILGAETDLSATLRKSVSAACLSRTKALGRQADDDVRVSSPKENPVLAGPGF